MVAVSTDRRAVTAGVVTVAAELLQMKAGETSCFARAPTTATRFSVSHDRIVASEP